ncbi:hypothetical protein CO230_08670 [Chryseobacterium sp. 6424]|uniref:tape measure protein n=1 Tax=Chryseobacterium sp. 6424 TaxID=2039166 RepID=UPI000EFACBAB|nr:tape measure protein [Chryseobacterium sp. 6424]AYO58187.1 hypothetical protein CO230_08670 [Chryseobacterium sp. 6424]
MYGFTLSLKDMFTSPLARISDALKRVNDQVDDLDEDVDQFSKRGGSSLGGLVGVVTRLGAAFVTFESVKALFNIGVQAEQTNTKFEVLLGSAEKGRALLDQLTQYANFTPYSGEGMNKAAETMLGFGIAQERIMPNMKMLGDIAMGNEEKLGSLSLVYSQIMATGKLMGQDLLQLINQGFNPLQIISDQTGLSMGVLKGKMEQGAISSDMISEAFRIATSEGGRYHKMAEKMAETAGGKWSTMMDAFAAVTRNVALRFAEWVKPIFDVGTAFAGRILPMLKWMYEYRSVIYTLVIAYSIYSGILLIAAARTAYLAWAVSWSTSAIIFNTIATYGWSGAWTVLNAAMRANPIGFIITLIGLLVAGVIWAWKNFEQFRGFVMGAWAVLKGFAQMIGDFVIGRINDLIKAIDGIGRAFTALKNGKFQEAFDIGKGVMGNLAGTETAAKFLESGKKLGGLYGQGYGEGVAMGKKTIRAPKTGAPETPKGPVKDNGVFNSLLGAGGGTEKGKGKGGNGAGSAAAKADGITGGGSKQTNINITIGKLQDQTVIHVDSSDKGINNLGDKVQELMLRAVNSVNQMQTT